MYHINTFQNQISSTNFSIKTNVKITSSCTGNMKRYISSHNKRLITQNPVKAPICNFISKDACFLEDQFKFGNIIYKCIASKSSKDDIVYLGGAEEFKQRFYNNRQSLKKKTITGGNDIIKYIV